MFIISQFLCGSGTWKELTWEVLAQGLSQGYNQAVDRGCCHLTTCLGMENPLPKHSLRRQQVPVPRHLLAKTSVPCHVGLSPWLPECPSNTPTDFQKGSDSRESKAEASCLLWPGLREKHHHFGHILSFENKSRSVAYAQGRKIKLYFKANVKKFVDTF